LTNLAFGHKAHFALVIQFSQDLPNKESLTLVCNHGATAVHLPYPEFILSAHSHNQLTEWNHGVWYLILSRATIGDKLLKSNPGN
jgi:hypothetical protein